MIKQTKTFFLNGQEYRIYKRISLNELISYFDYNSALLVLEYNNFICNKKNWNKIFITNKDKIEIVTIVGGG
uniref:Thiamine biosynthesis protein S n=1 Tax=Lithodesmium undulatum TaxID=59812 RepID=A0A023HC34_LITUN|nr:thiamine biosynthesis protein S [Lithodesmium undulatum]AGH29028.1 thiamine biosynthesis protein S [Lithodesmium undulatum]UYC30444.1 Thiamine biosynthesis protein [Lithodesmium undulatum]